MLEPVRVGFGLGATTAPVPVLAPVFVPPAAKASSNVKCQMGCYLLLPSRAAPPADGEVNPIF